MEELQNIDTVSERIGDFLVRIGALNATQKEAVLLEQQKQPDRLFGEIAISMGYIDERAIDAYLQSR